MINFSFKKSLLAIVILVTILTVSLYSCTKDKDGVNPPPKNPPIDNSNNWNEGLLPGVNYGIAAKYTKDRGLKNDKHVFGFEDFETGAVTLPTEEDRYKKFVKVVNFGSIEGNYCGEHSWPPGYDGPTTRFVLPQSMHQGNNPTYFVRMYLKHDESVHPYYGTTPPASGSFAAKTLKGFGIESKPPIHNYNEPCNGTNWYNASCQFTGWGPSQKLEANDRYLWVGHAYSYNAYPREAKPTVGADLIIRPNPWFRFSAYADPFTFLKFNRWYCYELGLYLNTPGKNDGEVRFWIDGVLQSRTTNIRFRDIESLLPTHSDLVLHRVGSNFQHEMKRYVDNIVISNRYIGPMKID
jgi:hypothetical protein